VVLGAHGEDFRRLGAVTSIADAAFQSLIAPFGTRQGSFEARFDVPIIGIGDRASGRRPTTVLKGAVEPVQPGRSSAPQRSGDAARS